LKPTLSGWSVNVQKTLFEQYADDARYTVTLYPTFVRILRVAVFEDKQVVQTEVLGEDGITVVETLITYDGNTAVMIDRERFGLGHEVMRTYPRDYEFPIGGTVRLKYA
jgi:hypothetical protein